MNNLKDPGQKAFLTREIKYLLLDYTRTRAYIKYKNGKKGHWHANEHQCTYNQLLYGMLPHILLDRQKGYNDLINYIEKRVVSEIITANIYLRFEDRVAFDFTCRSYYRGKLVECNDELIKKVDPFRTLYTFIKGGRVVVSEINPTSEDFRSHIENRT